MKKVFTSLCAVVALVMGSCSTGGKKVTPAYDQGINIIPMPKELVESGGTWELSSSTALVAQGQEAKTIAEFFAAKMRASTGYSIPVEEGASATGNISLSIDPALQLGDEGYTLTTTKDGVSVTGKSAQGLFYGMQSLLQLLPAEIESRSKVDTVLWVAPTVEIKDEPAYAYRGMLIDVCRHFITVEDMKRQIDVLSMFKINRLHWHLTEDQGWRIEIKKYPRLTEVGSKRIQPDGTEYGGFYTQEEIKEVVRYAQERFVTIIPEIELPGHAMGAIAAYPELACNPTTQKGNPYKVRTLWGVEQDVYCAGREHTFEFIKDVIDEVAPLFPGEYFHIGGDECPKIRWKTCPDCQRRIKEEGLKDEHELQSYVIRRAQAMLAEHGKKLIGWDEILEGGLAPSATVMSWRGEEGGIQSANMGHDVIMTPGSGGLYIDHYQGDNKIEPVAIFGYAPLSKTYAYDPVPEAIDPSKRHHILGAQANLWGEYLYTVSQMEYMAYPRVQALAELTWTPKAKKNFDDFARRINNAYVRLDAVGVNYHIPLPEQPGINKEDTEGSLGYVAFTDSAVLTLKSTRPVAMVYTTDGSEPTASSTLYTAPITVRESTVFKVASVLPHGKLSTVRTITYDKQALREATPIVEEQAGMNVRISVGNYNRVEDLASVTNWTEGRVETIGHIRPDGLNNNFDEIDRKAVYAEGYVLIPEDGVYVFSTNNEEFWLNGELLINNAGQVPKYSPHDTSRALKAGYHPFKALFIGHERGGFPSYWDDAQVRMRRIDSPTFEPIKVFTGKVNAQ